MKKRITSIIIAVAVLLSCSFVVPTTMHSNDCFAKSKSKKVKYIKVKKTTYNKMKATINNQSVTIQKQSSTIQKQSAAITNQSKLIDEQKAQLKNKKSQVSWLWSTLEDFGYFYNYDTHKWEPESVAHDEEDPIEEPQTIEKADMTEDDTQIEIIREETGLVIDCVQRIEGDNSWNAYYVYADGDIYVITVKDGHVAVCTQLN
jgi:lipopolysaccharide export LptBFGC system permease protein LptF